MNNDDWQKLKDWWGSSFHSSFELQCDEYKLSLHNWTYKMKVIVIPYVDGWQKGEWLYKEHPIGAKFFQLKKKALYSSKELKDRSKIWGKKSPESKQKYYEYVSSSWTSFVAFKKHIQATCKDIKIIES